MLRSLFILIQISMKLISQLENGKEAEDGDDLEPDDWLGHEGVVDVVSLLELIKEALNIQHCEEIEGHADGAPLAPARVVVESEQDEQIGHQNARAVDHVARHPEAEVLAAGLHVVCVHHQERQDKYHVRLQEAIDEVPGEQFE